MRTIRLLIVTFAALLLVGGFGAGVAAAQGNDYPIPVPEDGGVLPEVLTPPAEVTPLAQTPPVRANTGGLPVTGGDLIGLTVLGLGAIGTGVVLVRSRRVAA